MRVIEMFAGVGGFRIGLERASQDFHIIWSNQFEPGKKKQVAWRCYENNFGIGSCINKDISTVDVRDIPDFDLLTAGFPCQDYSVAKSLKYSSGIEGKKGVLWWDIKRVIEAKNPKYILLENVDRLIKSPSKQRGRDFGIILNCLMNLGYYVEWRVINAANFGMPQKRKRVFIFASKSKLNILEKTFSFNELKSLNFELEKDLLKVSNSFGDLKEEFLDYGIGENFNIITKKIKDNYNGNYVFLKDLVLSLENVSKEFYISEEELEKWKPFKLGRKIERVTKEGHKYIYSEGKMAFPDDLNKPARTIITGEGGATPSRFKHVIVQEGVYRRLTPIELERIQMFPDEHTKGFTDIERAFLMGNALVTGIVTEIGKTLIKEIK